MDMTPKIDAEAPRRRVDVEGLGSRSARSDAGDLAKQSPERLAGLYCQGLEPSKVRRTDVVEVAGHLYDRLDFGEGRAGCVEVSTVLPRTPARVALRDVEGNAVAGSAQLVGQRVLLIVGEAARRSRALDGKPLCVLPGLQGLVVNHNGMMSPTRQRHGTGTTRSVPFLCTHPSTSTQRLGATASRLSNSHPSYYFLEVRALARHQNPHPVDARRHPGHHQHCRHQQSDGPRQLNW